MFKVESYVTSILLSHVDKYVRDFKPSDAQVSLWGGGVALHNLVLKSDVLEKELALPFNVFSARIHELYIQVPWTKIMSEPIIVKIDTMECVFCNRNSLISTDEGLPVEPPGSSSQLVEAPPGYMQILVRRIIMNISLKVHHLIFKYVQNDIVVSLNVKYISIDSAGSNWEPTFSDIDDKIRKLVIFDDLTLCLDNSDADGKIRFFNEPLLYRCRIEVRVLTKLKSPTNGPHSSTTIQCRSSKLAWNFTSSHVKLILSMLTGQDSTKENKLAVAESTLSHQTSVPSEEPVPTDSWSKWAWSWLPSWINRQDKLEETRLPIPPTSIYINVYLDEVSLIFKVMEMEEGSHKRARGILELSTYYVAVKCNICRPTMINVKAGVRSVILKSQGKCVCGHLNINAAVQEPTIYLSKIQTEKNADIWKWPDEDYNDKVQKTFVVHKEFNDTKSNSSKNDLAEESNKGSCSKAWLMYENKADSDILWEKMKPMIYLKYTHDKSPSLNSTIAGPNLLHSNWQEECQLNIRLRLMQYRLSTELFHRISALWLSFTECQTSVRGNTLVTLTTEECETLQENSPQRRVNIYIEECRICMLPWDHIKRKKPLNTPLLLNIEIPNAFVSISSPLSSERVCLAASQLKEESGPLWQAARLHVTAVFESIEAKVCPITDLKQKCCARTNIRFVTHILLNKQMFKQKETVILSYSLKIRGTNVSGSSARLLAAWQIPVSLLNEKLSLVLQYTTLARDALKDEDLVTLDITLEDLAVRGYFTKNINTHIVTLQSAKVTALHLSDDGVLKKAWILSAPDVPSTTPYLRAAVQWCYETYTSLNYIGVWTQPTAFCIDPLFIAWLGYTPQFNKIIDVYPKTPLSRTVSSTQKRQHTNPTAKVKDVKLKGNDIIKLNERLKHMLITVELGMMLVYVTTNTVSESNCATMRLSIERHVASMQRVLVLSVGRWSMHSSVSTKQLWQDIRHDGPTFIADISKIESFPWKITFADISCYTMEKHAFPHIDGTGKERAAGLQSQLKSTHTIYPRTILELVTTSLTLSLITKSRHYRTFLRKPDLKKQSEPDKIEDKTKYFVSGGNFRPTTLKEFVRGPERRYKPTANAQQADVLEKADSEPSQKIVSGPVVSIGLNLQADTPPVVVRLDHDQVHMVAATMHCLKHLLTLFSRVPVIKPKKQDRYHSQALGALNENIIRSVSEIEGEVSEPEESDGCSELIPIFEAHPEQERQPNITKFLWFQWVINKGTVVVSTNRVKLACDIENIVTTFDVQEHFNQLKVKVVSTSVRYFNRTDSNEWIAGVLGGRIIEARDSVKDTHFLAATITQAQVSNMPSSWREELHPKFFEQTDNVDSVWEIYASLAPLEAVLQPTIFEKITSVAYEMAPMSFCPLQTEIKRQGTCQWPFCYIYAGGLRLLIACEDQEKSMETDDAFIISCDRITVNPHPENPMCRPTINAGADSSWQAVGRSLEGRQYEILVKNVTIISAQFAQFVYEEANLQKLKKGVELPTHELSRTSSSSTTGIPPVISSLDISCVLAPPLFIDGKLTCGSGVELNFMSNCAIDLSIDQLKIICRINAEMGNASRKSLNSPTHFHEKRSTMCPYATLLMTQDIIDDISYIKADLSGSDDDADLETATSRSTIKSIWTPGDVSQSSKKTSSVACLKFDANPKDYNMIFITMGTIELSFYTIDDNSTEIIELRPPKHAPLEPDESNGLSSAKPDRYLLLLHVMLQQPNLYYIQEKSNKRFQVSLFNAWVSLNAEEPKKSWQAVLMCTAQGTVDPISGIPPALATMKILMPAIESMKNSKDAVSGRATMHFDIERPVLFEVCGNRLQKLRTIFKLIERKLSLQSSRQPEIPQSPILYKLRQFMVQNRIATATVLMSQMGINGYEGSFGWDSASLQVAWNASPQRIVIRSLISAVLLTAGTSHDARHCVVQPLQLGFELNATWEPWRLLKLEQVSREPTIILRIDFDRMVFDVRPEDLSALNRIKKTLNTIFETNDHSPPFHSNSAGSDFTSCHNFSSSTSSSSTNEESIVSDSLLDTTDIDYNDDLRSNAFEIVRGSRLPLTYEITLYKDVVTWRYPHPRAIKRLIAFPLPDQNKEVECVLEMYNQVLAQWEPHTYFNLPTYDSREIWLYVPPPDAVFADLWRFRVYTKTSHETPFEFCMENFMPRTNNHLVSDIRDEREAETGKTDTRHITAEMLSSALRVDSYFAPQVLPRFRLCLQLCALELYAHNSMPSNSSQATHLDGYYVSKPLMLSHRVLTIHARGTRVHAELMSPAGELILMNTYISNDILDCASGTMEPLVNEFAVQLAMTLHSKSQDNPRLRIRSSRVHLDLHVPGLRTLHALTVDWKNAVKKPGSELSLRSNAESSDDKLKSKQELADTAMTTLEGRVSLWLQNNCVCALRVGQEGTTETLLLESGTRLAYRWRNPTSTRRLRFAFANPSADWHWSNSIPFSPNSFRVRLEGINDSTGGSCNIAGSDAFLHIDVKQAGSIRCMHLSGRLLLANMLRIGLLYKVRLRFPDSKSWRTLSTGELGAERIGRSIVCGTNCEMVLKIKNLNKKYSWSGDIPLKECPKENIPWLVKVPSEGDVAYMSVWCRVVRARLDGRILAAIWPLYVLHSHLPLDTDVLIVTETNVSSMNIASEEDVRPPPLIQLAPGRGVSTHLLAPGTTVAKHSLSFQYRNIECPVTRDAVPLHYGVTDTSVFDKSALVNNINEVLQDVVQWLNRSRDGTETSWPYSLVTKHWAGTWNPPALQPRCDVTVRYEAVRAGGGCSLKIHLSPVVLLCNASPVALTLRSFDAAPLCKLDKGTAISPSTAILSKPFYMSVEMGRETFKSGQLQVCTENLGHYGALSNGQVALGYPTTFFIQCNQKMALFTMYYEIKDEINVLGITTTYSLINMLDTNILVSAIAVAGDDKKHVLLHPKTYKVLKPTSKENFQGIPLCRFWLRERWRGGYAAQLQTFLCFALPAGASTYPANFPVPVRLGKPPARRALTLIDINRKSNAVVVTQHKHEGRWYISVAPDPCPQFIVHNQTCYSLAIAQPQSSDEEAAYTSIVSDCAGARWWNIVEQDAVIHYSTPDYCARSSSSSEDNSAVSLLTFSRIKDDSEPEWCVPVAAIDGEQLVPLCRGITIRMRVRMHPHCSLIELQNNEPLKPVQSRIMERVCAENKMKELVRCIVASVDVVMSATGDSGPIFALYVDRIAVLMLSDAMKTKTSLSVTGIQVDNCQYESNQFDFAVLLTTNAESLETDRCPTLWNMFAQQNFFSARRTQASVLVNICYEKWTVVMYTFNELTEVEIRVGPLALYLEEAYLKALVELFRLAIPRTVTTHAAKTINVSQSLQRPLCLRTLHVHPLDLTLTLHTSGPIYIALDQSSLHLSPFKLQNMMMSTEHLTHELIVHYLSAAVLGAGWVVGGLELLGAPGAFAARAVGPSAGVKDIASAIAAVFLRSLSAWAKFLAYNLDILAGDEANAKRARYRSPDSFMAGVTTGITNIAVNVFGIAGSMPQLYPQIGQSVTTIRGTENNTVSLKRGFLSALTNPLSVTADLVAFAGYGLLKQTGWDNMPQPRTVFPNAEYALTSWRRNCVRWAFSLAQMTVLAGFEVMLNNAQLQLLFTHKFIVVADPESERVIEMIDLRFCTLSPHEGPIIELHVSQRRVSKLAESRAVDEDDEYQINLTAMNRRTSLSTGDEDSMSVIASRVLFLLPAQGQSHALHAWLAAALHYNSDTYFALL